MALIAWYRLDDSLIDSSGNNRNLTITGTTSYTSTGKIGSALDLNGSSHASATYSLPNSNPFTMACWVRTTSTPATEVGIIAFGFYPVTVLRTNGGVRTWWYNNVSYPQVSTNTPINDGKWHHIATTYDGINVRLYLDGALQATTASSIIVTHSGLMLGREYNNGEKRLTGQIDDARFYNHALTDMEVQELARAKILHYSFDDFQEPTTNISKHSTKSDITPDGYAVLGVNFSKNLTGSGFTNPQGHNAKYSIDVPPGIESRSIEFTHANQNGQVDFGWFGPYNSVNTLVGEVYTVSFWIKFVDRIPTPVFNLGFKVHGSTGGSSEMFNSWISNCTLGNWHYVSFQVTITTALTNDLWILIFDVLNANERIRFSDFQIEKKAYSTEFTIGSRTGKVNDYSGFFNHSQNLTETNTPRWTSDAKIGTGAYDFNGTNNFIRYNQKVIPDSSNEYTFSVWAKPDGTGGGSDTRRFIMETSPNWAISCAFNSSLNQITMYNHNNNSNTYTLPSGNFIGKWTHIAGVFKLGSYQKLYVNGQEVSSVATLNATSSTTLINFGTYRGADNRWFGGEIDDVRIYTTALSDADILDLYQTKAEIEQSGVLYARDFTNEGTIVAFTNVGETTWTKPADAQYAEILIVGGGAGGGSKSKGSSGGTAGGAGGGAGGLIYAKIKLDNSTYNIKVGAGGAGGGIPSGGGSTQNGFNGENSFFNNLIAIGGGGGARNGAIAGVAGGSGGGASSFALGGLGTANQGNKGGDFIGASDTGFYPRAGGGGAGEPGGNAINSSNAGKGGDGLYFGNIFGNNYGENGWFAGGGGGSWRNGSNITGAARGGLGGGTNGGIQNSTKVGDFFGSNDSMPPAMPNTGGGGGGQGGSDVNLLGHASSGGSGIVLIKYYPNEIRENGNAYFYSFSTVGVTDGLIGYWPLNGDARDLSGLNSTENTITAITWVSGKVDSGADLNGTTSKIYINNNDAFNFIGNQQYTAMAMIYPRLGGTTWHGIFSKGNAQQWALTLNSPNGYLHYETNQGGVGALNTAFGTILANTWYHVAIRFNGTNKQIFINGVSAATQTATALNSASNTEVLRIGEGNTGELFNGIIDEVKVFNRALTDEEMMIEYNTMFNNQVQIHESGVVYARDLEQY